MLTGGVKVARRRGNVSRDGREMRSESPIPPEEEDYEVIPALRNAEHRRMQVKSSSRLATYYI